MQFLLIDISTMVAAGLALVALMVGKRRLAGNKADLKPQSLRVDHYVDPRRLVNLR